MSGLIGLVIFILDIWAVVQIFKTKAENGTKILWALLVLVLPLLGLAAWYFAGPKK